jgi:2-polyprenyl-6-methoxyphenol hydroxylase-like FAD-dependent oxidoreductase
VASAFCASDVLIVGGGFAGVVAALTLASDRRRVTVLEASAAPPRFSGDLIHPLGKQLLAETGVLPQLLARGAVPIDGFAVFPVRSADARNTSPTKLPYRESARGVAMNSRALVEALRVEARGRSAIEFRSGCEAVAILRRGGRVIGVRDRNGCEWLARLTIIAQGRHAALRRQLGFDEKPRALSISTALSLRGVALPVPNYAHIFLNAARDGIGPLLAHPLGDGEVRVSIDLPRSSGAGGLRERIRRAHLRGLPPELAEALHEALEGSDDEEQLATRTTCAFRTLCCAAPGVALVGDAAGCTHPITGTGMTTALVDARILRDELDRVDQMGPRADAVERALIRYQHRRYRFARPRELLAEGLYEIFCAQEEGAGALRCGLFRYWNASAHARTISVALLSGEDSSLRRLFTEYIRVSATALRAAVIERKFAARAEKLSTVRALVRNGIETFVRFARGVRSLRSTRYAVAPGR